MNEKVSVGIVGAAGYTGSEMLRLLIHHPNVGVAFAHSRTQAGKPVVAVHADLAGETALAFTDKMSAVDVLFLCLGAGESRSFLQQNPVDKKTRIIDLSQDFRLGEMSGERGFVYGLPECARNEIKGADAIANPGCFATAIQLGLLPLAKAGLLHEVFSTGITGSTGAGQRLQETTHFTWRANNIQPYKTLSHQHMAEIMRTLHTLQKDAGPVSFIPWRGDFTRGILVSSCVTTTLPLEEANSMFRAYYEGHPFTVVADQMISLKQVVNTNKCLLALEKAGDKLVIHSALDNLLKGASGQAVQNMNLMLGVEETAGLWLKGIAF